MIATWLRAGFRVLGWSMALGMLPALARAEDDERKAGDRCNTAFQINGPLPTSVSGTTVGFSNDYDEACPYGGSTAPDVVYRYTPAADETVDLLLCLGDTDFDTKLYVYDACPPVTAIACNDDACASDTGQGFVSALWNLPLYAGTTYYIVVDGYDNAAGNYTLTMRRSYPPPDCADNAAVVFGQVPGMGNWTLSFSDFKGGYWAPEVRYEDFWGLSGRVAAVKFWGLSFQYLLPGMDPGYWDQCSEDPASFEIRFYEDAGGLPGTEVYAFAMQLSGTLVGHVGYGLYDIYEYTAVLPAPLLMQAGWVSIAGTGGSDCWFAWMNSAAGNQRSCSPPPTCSGEPFNICHYDLALCLMTDGVPGYGACCDEGTGVCQENVAISDCPGRFMPGGTCADFDPPCGGITGACYHGGKCAQATQRDCQLTCAGDLNCDGKVDFGDINPFVKALTRPAAYEQSYPDCRLLNADCNGDGLTDFGDINPFITLIGTTCPTGTWAGLGRPCAPWEWGQDPPVIYSYEIPYRIADSTDPRQDYFEGTCLAPFDQGNDRVYALVIEENAIDVRIQLAPYYAFYTGMLLTDHYPPDGNCIATAQNSDTNAYSLGCVHLEPGTYYLMVSNWPPPDSIDSYELSIATCTPDDGRCCYNNGAQCAVVTEAECDALGGVWDAGLDCASGCPSRYREDCANAEVIPSLPFSEVFYNDTLTADGPAAPCDKYGATGLMQNDAWFTWTADTTGLATATALGAYDPVLSVWETCAGATPLLCSDDSPAGEPETRRFWIVTGTTYYFQVGTVGNHPGGGWTSFQLGFLATGGACCLPDGSCQVTDPNDCVAQSGTFQNDPSCSETTCADPGADCAAPVTISLAPDALPYFETNWTTVLGNRYANTCLGSFDSGNDIIYELLVTQTVVVNITLDPMGTDYTGIALSDHCPPTECIAKSVSAGTAPHGLKYIVLRPGIYYLMIDKWLTPPDIPAFMLTIENADPYLGACCVNAECVASTMLAACLDLGGTWHRGEPCDSATCEPQPGDTCLDPIVVELTPYFYYYQDWFDTLARSNTYAGTTCLGTYDGGKEVVYKLVVPDADVCVNIRLSDGDRAEPHMALFDTCPPTRTCLATPQELYGIEAFRDLVLSPGVYYLMIDVWPQWWGTDWVDYADGSIWIEPCDYGGSAATGQSTAR